MRLEERGLVKGPHILNGRHGRRHESNRYVSLAGPLANLQIQNVRAQANPGLGGLLTAAVHGGDGGTTQL
jgi:hypothetical protein